jgi:phosphoesterase RecJ-like protein
LSIDHHRNGGAFARNLLLDADCSATGELMVLLLKQLNVKLTRDIAEPLYIAIATDTGCFRYGNSTGNTLRATAELLDTGINASAINSEHFEKKTVSRFAIEAELMRDIKSFGKLAVMFLTIEKIEKTKATYDDLDGISALARTIAGVEIGVTLREEKDGSTKLSVRSASEYSALDICEKLGGGGHPRAAGALLKTDIETAYVETLNAIYGLYPELR